jgi:lipoate-protein ligase B
VSDAHQSRPKLYVEGPRMLDYDAAFELQLDRRERCLESEGRRNYLLLVEHTPVITVGRSGSRADVLADDDLLAQRGVRVVETNRGGRVTFHGPGQLVVYPIVDLKLHGRDLHRYLRDLEAWLIGLCGEYGVPAHADGPHTGVWVEGRKIASIGIAVRRWVAYHGIALNLNVDLDYFRLIVPCGVPEVKMTSLEREMGQAPPLENVAEKAAKAFAERFAMEAVKTATPEVAAR